MEARGLDVRAQRVRRLLVERRPAEDQVHRAHAAVRDQLVLDHGDVAARIADAQAPGGRVGQDHQAIGLAARPAREGQHALRAQVPDVLAHRLQRIESVLGEREGPGRSGGPGVDQRELDQVVALSRGAHEAAPVGHVRAHPRVVVEPTAPLPKASPHHVLYDDRVDLHGVDVSGAVQQRREHVPPAARPDHERAPFGRHHVPQGRELVAQVLVGVARQERDDGRGRLRVDVHAG